MFKKVLNKLMGRKEVILRGVDSTGIKYFSEASEGGLEKRWFEHPTGEMFPKEIPAEWHSWLRHRREVAPTPELSGALEKVRAQTLRNAQLWEEEMAQMELRDKLSDGGVSTPQHGFEYIVQKLQSETDVNEESIEFRGDNPATAAAASNIMSESAINDPNISLHAPPSMIPKGYEKNNRDIFPTTSERGLAPKIDANMAYHPSEKKAIDTTNMTAEELRETSRAYSQSRTSRFLGVKPQMRTEAMERMEQLAREKQQEQEKKGKDDQ